MHGVEQCMGWSNAWGETMHGVKQCMGFNVIHPFSPVEQCQLDCLGEILGSIMAEEGSNGFVAQEVGAGTK